MNIRKSTLQDLPQILNLYKIAREFMKNNGNPNQWEDRYPEVSTVENDIKTGISHVCVENGGIVGTFVFFTGEDPTYRVIENGEWHSDREPYGVIHRVASNGVTKGVTRLILFQLRRQLLGTVKLLFAPYSLHEAYEQVRW